MTGRRPAGRCGELARAHLISEHAPGRYGFHDLLRAYAAEQARGTEQRARPARPPSAGCSTTTCTPPPTPPCCSTRTRPDRPGPARPGAVPEQPADHRQALAWFEAEHQVLLAAVALAAESGFDAHAWQLAWAMAPFLQTRGHWHDWAATQRTALAAATRLGDPPAQAVSSRLLAAACAELGDYDQAARHLAAQPHAVPAARQPPRRGQDPPYLGRLAEHQGRYAEALGHGEQALRLYQAIGDKAGEAAALNNVGWYHALLGDYQQARAFCRQALALYAETGHHNAEGNAGTAWATPSTIWATSAKPPPATSARSASPGNSATAATEADALTHLGDTRHAAGELARAREAWQQALAIYEDMRNPDSRPGARQARGTGQIAPA